MKHVAVIDYGSGNLRSVSKSLESVAPDGVAITVTQDARALAAASHIVLPGVGAFGDCMDGLLALPGMREALEDNVRAKQKPFLGICVGMQMMLTRGFENGDRAGLGWIGGEVVRLDNQMIDDRMIGKKSDHLSSVHPSSFKIPHMGWNELLLRQPQHALFKNIPEKAHAYFVHSFHAQCASREAIAAEVDYGGPVVAALAQDNLMGTQFHPEKSQQTGLQLLQNFLEM